MEQLDVLVFYSFPYSPETISVQYFFTKEGFTAPVTSKGVVWMAIKTERFTIKILKPESILAQPRKVIEKIVEREVFQLMASESIQDV
jgi:hypothetical protein